MDVLHHFLKRFSDVMLSFIVTTREQGTLTSLPKLPASRKLSSFFKTALGLPLILPKRFSSLPSLRQNERRYETAFLLMAGEISK
jgi:hypothetical protein